jgi:two-component system, chemotaxis family, chemotaxis protein CheY
MSKTVLTVDSSPSSRQMLARTLIGAGYRVVEADDGADALSKAQAAAMDMVLTDLEMPGMSGLELIRELRRLPAYDRVPLLFLAEEADLLVKQEARVAGATGWISKPFEREQLVTVVRQVLGP